MPCVHWSQNHVCDDRHDVTVDWKYSSGAAAAVLIETFPRPKHERRSRSRSRRVAVQHGGVLTRTITPTPPRPPSPHGTPCFFSYTFKVRWTFLGILSARYHVARDCGRPSHGVLGRDLLPGGGCIDDFFSCGSTISIGSLQTPYLSPRMMRRGST